MSSLPKKNEDGTSYISYSQMRMYKQCPKAYEFRYVEGIREPLPGRVMIGSAFDAGANTLLRMSMEGNPVDQDAGISAALEYVDNPDGEFDLTDIAGDDELTGKMMGAIREYSEIIPTMTVKAVQEKVEYMMKDDVMLIGNIDLIELCPDASGDLMITDNKSTLKKKSGKFTFENAIVDQQLTLYAMAVQAVRDERVTGRGWRVVDIGRKTPGRVESVHIKDENPKATEELAKNYALATINMIENSCDTGLFAPTARGTWACTFQYCEFFNRCEYGSRNRNAVPIGNI